MNLEIWIAFVFATIVVTLLPGPSMLIVIGHAIATGPKKALATVSGAVLADAILLCFSLVGVGTILYTSAVAFTVMKWIGAAYLIYIGVKQWRTTPKVDEVNREGEPMNLQKMFLHGFITTMLNPKIIGFFIAFFPQFIVSNSPMLPQLLILGTTFLILAFIIMAGYGVLAGQMRRWFKEPNALQMMNRTSGATLIGAGLMTAALEQK